MSVLVLDDKDWNAAQRAMRKLLSGLKGCDAGGWRPADTDVCMIWLISLGEHDSTKRG